ncbi:dihydrodipicolinate synthase family protein [Halosimplex aquaticum]|uniref:Dihydrodipicolinate synthase family protein n=1 Tax=Halosimplex aquaticum TaxID=3026162 RepID=A0ABD5Y3D9_9EURY|nr:dihydrodipicolinate synthase family protein [Halosimplex aquaticum]
MLSNATRVLCPLVTPFDDGAVDHDALATVVNHLADRGVDGFVPCGTTGEFASLTQEERTEVVETTVEVAPSDAPVVAGAAGTAVETVRGRIADVAAAGADAALTVSPYYVTASEPSSNQAFFERVVADSPIPIYLYNIPSVVNEEIAPETVEALAERESVVGLKDTSGDLTHVTDVLDRVPDDFEVLQGFDGQLVPGLYMGMDAGVNSVSHVIPEAVTEAVESTRAGDHDRARGLQRHAVDPLFRCGSQYGFSGATKVMLAHEGLIDDPEVRPPLELPDPDEREEIQSTLDRVGDRATG